MDLEGQQTNSSSAQSDPGTSNIESTESKNVIKDQAVTALLPLVDQLEGNPQRKFEILITAARTADDSGILKKALDAALQIENPSEKAEALLDIINEASL